VIKVNVQRKNSLVSSIELSGHAGSGPYGFDLVCAAVSGISIGTVNAIGELTNVDLTIEEGGEGGYLKIVFSALHSNSELDKAQLLVEGMLVSLRSVEKEYGEFIQIIGR
jgi:hypothetical protein